MVDHVAVAPRREFFFVNDTATTEIYTLSLHDALPICAAAAALHAQGRARGSRQRRVDGTGADDHDRPLVGERKSTHLDAGHPQIKYAYVCLHHCHGERRTA